jgi:hypothetical protein
MLSRGLYWKPDDALDPWCTVDPGLHTKSETHRVCSSKLTEGIDEPATIGSKVALGDTLNGELSTGIAYGHGQNGSKEELCRRR